MMRIVRPALVISLMGVLAFGMSSVAHADHQFDDHAFCAQGGGQGGPSSGGPGGTLLDEDAAAHFQGGGPAELPDTVLVPQHLAERFGEEPPPAGFPDPNAGEQFIEIDADEVADDSSSSSGSAFHGGHGGGPGGGQGGSTFFGGGDGGCNPRILEAARRQPPGVVQRVPGERLPVTGSPTQQFGILAGLFIALGGTLWMFTRGRTVADLVTEAVPGSTPAPAPRPRRGQVAVSRLRAQMKGSWVSAGRRTD